jgi:predicted GNAT family N-acyltransferase
MIQFSKAASDLDLQQILVLQKENLPNKLSKSEIESQGFVTISHDFNLLAEMNAKSPHIIVKFNGEVIGYALVMLEFFKDRIPVLFPMFQQIDKIEYGGKLMREIDYFVMGQVCIAKPFRGQGIFKGLFEKMKNEMAADFKMVVTEVATRNQRSMKAHFKVGFKIIKKYQSEVGEKWAIIAWDWK